MFSYSKIFILKNKQHRSSVDLLSYKNQINDAVDKYNNISNYSLNRKQIDITIFNDHLEFDIQSQRRLNPKYVGLSLKLLSQILVEDHGFLSLCTNSDPRKLFITA